MTIRKLVIAASVGAAAVLALAACGPKETTEPAMVSTPAEPESMAPAEDVSAAPPVDAPETGAPADSAAAPH